MNEALTSGDLALWATNRDRRGWYGGDGCYENGGYYHRRGHSGQRATGIALGAVGTAAAVIGIPLALVAAKAMASKAEAMAEGNARMISESNHNIRLLTQGLADEVNARQNHINYERSERIQSNPTTQNYIDLAAGAGAYSGSGSSAGAQAQAAAAALAAQNGGYGWNNAVENMSFVRTIPFSEPKPCCGGCGQ